MPVYYGDDNIIPGPFVEIVKETVRSEDGKVRRKFFTLTAKGKLVAYAGSPRSNGQFWNQGIGNPPANEIIPADSRLAAIKNKQAALIKAFSIDYKAFEIQPFDGTASIKCYPRIRSVSFAEGKWTDVCDFTIVMEADNVWWGNVSGDGGIDGLEPEESWQVEVEQGDNRVYRVSHTCSSQQKASYDVNGALLKEGWDNAKTVVEPFVGLLPPTAILPLGYLACDYARSQTADVANGRFTVTENWLYTYNQRYTEDMTVNCRFQDGLSTVSVEGTISGHIPHNMTIDPFTTSANKYAQALTVWNGTVSTNLLTRAQNYSGIPLNPIPVNQTVGFNPTKGVITYTYEFDNRPPNLVPGSISESISVQQENPTDVIAQLVVLGQPAGPVIQSIGTVTAKVRSVTVEVVMPRWVYGSTPPSSPNVAGIILTYYPAGFAAFCTKDSENWNLHSGRYSRSVAWTYR